MPAVSRLVCRRGLSRRLFAYGVDWCKVISKSAEICVGFMNKIIRINHFLNPFCFPCGLMITTNPSHFRD